MSNSVKLDNLSIGYRLGHGKRRLVAEGLSATLAAGSLTCLLGRNGTGKSTLLRTLAGFQPPLSGHVSFGPEEPQDRSKKVSVVLTEPLALHHLSVGEVVGMGRTPYTNFWGTLSMEDQKVVAESMQLVGIDHLRQHDIATLSDGERQKVMIAKALAQQTPIIILDEPTAFLDYPSKREVMTLLSQLAHEQQKAILLSTHDVELAEQFADQIWFLLPQDSDSYNSLGGSRLLTGTAQELHIRALF